MLRNRYRKESEQAMSREYDMIPSDGKQAFTPCDFPDENGKHHCPYADTYTGYEDEMCRNCCGLGVDV